MTIEEAIKTLEVAIAAVEWEYPMNYAVAIEMAITALRAQQEAEKNEPQGGWISVKDRLPENKGEYLVAFHLCVWDCVDKEICIGLDTFRGKSSWAKKKYQRVIYWMPLPEPPKGEQHETIDN